jgi:light-regulated signal transduction histidine kinase (bacteriophytochrome)
MNRTIRAATQMQQLIHDLLLYSRTTSSSEHFKKTDLNGILRDVTKRT